MHAATCMALAYAVILQLVLAGLAAERMVFAATGAGEVLCAGGTAPDDAGGTAPPVDHAACRAICAAATAFPLVPEAATAQAPGAILARPDRPLTGQRFALWDQRREPRTSQGPPSRA